MSGEIKKVSRRGFLKGLAAGGLLLALDRLAAPALADASTTGAAVAKRGPTDPLVWVAIAPDGLVTIVVARSEMGQGSRSTLALAIADELEADRARVRIQQAHGDESRFGSQNTDGSRSIRQDLVALRTVGAAARQMLEQAAANAWGVPVAEVAGTNHAVVHLPTGRRKGYGELAASAWRLPVPEDPQLKPKARLRYLGKERQPSFDLDDMVTGRATFGADVALPGLKYAMVARPPVYGGTPARVDDAAARAVAGVERVVRLPDGAIGGGFKPLGGVAVVATNTWAAKQGRDALAITWNDGPNKAYDSEAYKKRLIKTVEQPGQAVAKRGNVDRALTKAHRRVRATYYVPHLAHAPMEPLVATAHVTAAGCEIWAPTQHPHAVRETVAGVLGIPLEQVTVHVTLLGGGFGRKSKPDFIAEAALLSKAVGAPVRVQWTREDDLRHGYYHTVSAQHLEAAIDAKGRVDGWLHRMAYPTIASTFLPILNRPMDPELGMGVTDLPYDIPNIRVETGPADAHVRIGWYRAVANIQQAFAINSFAAELAAAIGRDPKDMLLALIGEPRRFEAPKWNYGAEGGHLHPVDTGRLRRVIEVAAERAGWGKRQLRPGHGLGIAAHRSFLSYVATVVEVTIDADGNLTIPAVHSAIDCGFVANPDRVRAQLEGAAVMACSNALHGAITFKDGRVEQSNFHDYQVARLNVAPRHVHAWIVESDHASGGVGEAGVPPFAPALCNAIHAAIGKRIRHLPIADQLAPR